MQKKKIPSTVYETLKHLSFQAFTNIKILLRILGTIPVTTCTCERCISKLRLLKDYTKSTMINDRLNGIALMHKSLLNGISGKTTNISYIFKKMQLCLNFHFFSW